MSKKKELQQDDAEQSARFTEKATEIQENGSEEKFEKAMRQILSGEEKYVTTNKEINE